MFGVLANHRIMMPVLHKFQTFRRSGHRLHFTRVHYFGEPQVSKMPNAVLRLSTEIMGANTAFKQESCAPIPIPQRTSRRVPARPYVLRSHSHSPKDIPTSSSLAVF